LKLAEALLSLVQRLEGHGVRFAVVGGLAASARGEARFTRDVDVATAVDTDEDAEAVVFSLQQAGYLLLATVEQDAAKRLATARLRNPQGIVCDLIFATSGIEREVVESAEPLELFEHVLVPTATAEALLAMKTLSASAKRARDLEDIRAILLENPSFDEARVKELLGTIERRGYARGQRLLEKWHKIRADFG
jgi:Nucleotidyl transferase AbiEii toxin, Type IV TA system